MRLYRDYIGVILGLYRGYMEIMEKWKRLYDNRVDIGFLGVIWEIMENKMETTIL